MKGRGDGVWKVRREERNGLKWDGLLLCFDSREDKWRVMRGDGEEGGKGKEGKGKEQDENRIKEEQRKGLMWHFPDSDSKGGTQE